MTKLSDRSIEEIENFSRIGELFEEMLVSLQNIEARFLDIAKGNFKKSIPSNSYVPTKLSAEEIENKLNIPFDESYSELMRGIEKTTPNYVQLYHYLGILCEKKKRLNSVIQIKNILKSFCLSVSVPPAPTDYQKYILGLTSKYATTSVKNQIITIRRFLQVEFGWPDSAFSESNIIPEKSELTNKIPFNPYNMPIAKISTQKVGSELTLHDLPMIRHEILRQGDFPPSFLPLLELHFSFGIQFDILLRLQFHQLKPSPYSVREYLLDLSPLVETPIRIPSGFVEQLFKNRCGVNPDSKIFTLNNSQVQFYLTRLLMALRGN